MVAKVIAYAQTRDDAIRLLARALDDCVLLGVNSNKQFLANLLRHPVVVAGDTNTAFIQQHFQADESLQVQTLSLEHLAVTAALFTQTQQHANWSTGLSPKLPLKLQIDEQKMELLLEFKGNSLSIETCGQTQSIEVLSQTPQQVVYVANGVRRKLNYILQDQQLYLDVNNGNVSIQNITYAPPEMTNLAGDGKIKAPMDGAVIQILVNVGDQVAKGQTLLILEAMKIQQQIKSDVDGVVKEVIVQTNQQVKKRQVLFYIQSVE